MLSNQLVEAVDLRIELFELLGAGLVINFKLGDLLLCALHLIGHLLNRNRSWLWCLVCTYAVLDLQLLVLIAHFSVRIHVGLLCTFGPKPIILLFESFTLFFGSPVGLFVLFVLFAELTKATVKFVGARQILLGDLCLLVK